MDSGRVIVPVVPELVGVTGCTGPTGPQGATGPARKPEEWRADSKPGGRRRKGPPARAEYGGTEMTTHKWELTSVGQGPEGGQRFEWKCAQCLCTTFTNGGGQETADQNRPGRRALQATWVDPDCGTALVNAVHDL